MHPYVQSVQSLLVGHADPDKAIAMTRYLRDQFPHLGIQSPKMGTLLKQFYADHGLPSLADLDTIVRELWALPEREFQYVATGLMGRLEEQLLPDFIETIEYLLVTKSWWDTVDGLAAGPVGTLFKHYPDVRAAYLAKWRKSDNFWLRRTTILYQLDYKNETDFALLCELIRENLGSKEFFINKAIGWALRQYTRIDPDGVREFVAATALHPLSAREALKWLEKKKKA